MARGYQDSAGIERPTSAADPADEWDPIEPSDTEVLPRRYRGLFVTVAGQLTLVGHNGETMSFAAEVGPLPLRPAKVLAAGTSATVYGVY